MVDSSERISIDEHSVKENTPPPRTFRRGQSNGAGTLAMKLNNKGASCIQCADYRQAIFLLSRALKITEKGSNDHAHDITPCDCYHCTLESCMMNHPLSQRLSKLLDHPNRKSSKPKVRKFETKGLINRKGFLYVHPLFASLLSIREEHFMGETLSMMILFNLALAYQLEGTLSRARKLYELCYRLQVQSSQKCCLWFTMCISNNLSEIHRCEGNEQYSACLNHLLSTMMYIVDCHMVSSHTHMEGVHLFPNRLRCADFHQYMMNSAMDGFVRNSSNLILFCRVASAA